MGFAVAGVVFFFVFRRLAAGWSEIGAALREADWLQALLGVVVIALALAVSAASWKRIMKDLYQTEVSFAQALIIINVPNVFRYVPGKLWFVFGIKYFSKLWGIDERGAITTAFVNQFAIVVAALVVGGVFSGVRGMSVLPWWVAPFIVVVSLLLMMPRFFHSLVSFFFRRKGISGARAPTMKLRTAAVALGCAVVLWLGVGFGLTISTAAFLPQVSLKDAPAVMGGFPLSYVIGYASIVVPAGLGVREGVFMLLLPPSLSAANRAAASVGTRIWMTLAELVNTAIAFLIFVLKYRRKSASLC